MLTSWEEEAYASLVFAYLEVFTHQVEKSCARECLMSRAHTEPFFSHRRASSSREGKKVSLGNVFPIYV